MNLHLTNVEVPRIHSFSDFNLITFCNDHYIGVEESFLHEGLDVYYNSVDCNITINSLTPVSSIQLFDMSGKMLQSLTPHDDNVTISLSSYPQGIYIIKVASSEAIITQKIVKH